MLGNISQARVSQLVKQGVLVAERDTSGQYQYDRIATEALSRNRAMLTALKLDAANSDEQRALHAEAQDRFHRQRARERAIVQERQDRLDVLYERAVLALEQIVTILRKEGKT